MTSTSHFQDAETPLTLSPQHQEALSPYLPAPRSVYLSEPSSSPIITIPPGPSFPTQIPWVTLTYATSLDSRISLAPGVRTTLSGSETKAMTHYLRVCHDAILIGVGTAEADDPGLRSRFVFGEEGEWKGDGEEGLKRQPVPFILDPTGRWKMETCEKLFENAGAGGRKKVGRAPWWIVSEDSTMSGLPNPDPRIETLSSVNGHILPAGSYKTHAEGVEWEKILRAMWATGVRSVMIEGGARVINDLLRERNQWLVKSMILTVAPVYLGRDGVEVAPVREGRPLRLGNVRWLGMGEDAVMGGFLGSEGGG